jgi:hypothetical protein
MGVNLSNFSSSLAFISAVREASRRDLRLFCAFGGFPLFTPFRLRPLLFLTLEFFLTLLESHAHRLPPLDLFYVHSGLIEAASPRTFEEGADEMGT